MKAAISRFLAAVKWFIIYRVLPAVVLIGGGIGIGAIFFATSSVSYAEHEVIKEVQVKGIAPVMDRIAKCESGNSQTKDGQVLIHINTNGTYDQGAYQINSIHNADATKRGFELSTAEGNKGYAYWMYENLGTGDWASSQACWKVLK